jgi:hypothetical protein
MKGTKGAEIIKELKPGKGDYVVGKITIVASGRLRYLRETGASKFLL